VKFSQQSFDTVVELFESKAGIRYTPEKKQTVAVRLMRLAKDHGASSLDDYVGAVLGERPDPEEVTRIVDRLTTNETYFFREPGHFEYLENLLAAHERGRTFRVWSAASSSGEEAYSVAMVLADRLGINGGWEVVGTDLSTAMIAAARTGLYGMERIDGIERQRLQRYCRKGDGPYRGKMLIAKELRAKVRFEVANLTLPFPPALKLGRFDVIFLRNVLIYFDLPTKKTIIERLLPHLDEHGAFFTGHAESLAGVTWDLAGVQPAVYERVG
jgi:chemotaxis protein methyltransferase CheR